MTKIPPRPYFCVSLGSSARAPLVPTERRCQPLASYHDHEAQQAVRRGYRVHCFSTCHWSKSQHYGTYADELEETLVAVGAATLG
jgi:hypothetical protein